MTQLALIEVDTTPRLTDRQAAVLQAVTTADHEGITADEAGAHLHALKDGRWAHSPDDRCQYCARDGNAVLKRLQELHLVRYRRARNQRPGGWVAVGAAEPDSQPSGMLADTDPIPF